MKKTFTNTLITYFLFLIPYSLFLLPFSLSELFAGWPTTPDSALHVGYGKYPMLTVDPLDQSITVVYLVADGVFAKKFDLYGEPLWGGNEITLMDTTGGFYISEVAWPHGQWGQIISDRSGGAVVCWEDFRHAPLDPNFWPLGSEVFIQRVDSSGQICYGINGRRISGPATAGWHNLGDMKPDYHGGFVIAFRNDTVNTMSMLKRFDWEGNLLWNNYFNELGIDLNATNTKGQIFVSTFNTQVKKRHKLDLWGNHLWPDTLSGRIPDDTYYRHGGAFPDGAGGAIGVGPSGYLTINRVDSMGRYLFGENGIDLGEGQQTIIGYASDKNGGLFVSWTRNGSRVQSISKNGNILFPPGGIKVTEDSITLGSHRIISDNNNGVISIWADRRLWPIRSYFVQRIDSSGQLLWDTTGIEFLSSAQDLFFTGSALPWNSDGRDGAIFIGNEGPSLRIIMKQISKNGIFGEVITGLNKKSNMDSSEFFQLSQNYPNPFNSSTTINFKIHKSEKIKLIIYTITGQIISILINRYILAGNHQIIWNAKDNNESQLASGIYIYTLIGDNWKISKKLLLIR